MKRSYLGLALGALVTIGAVLSLPSCGHDQKLVSLSIQPQSFTFLAPAGSEQYTVIGTFIHPPATKDLTAQATWAVDDGVVHISAGLVSPDPALGCGGGTISATVPAGTGGSSNTVTAYSTVTVENPNDPLCPGGGKLATLNVLVQGGTGTVTSSPSGINCPGTCNATLAVGTSVTLTANTGTIQSWQNCSPGTGNSCSLTISSGGAAVVATFQ